MTWNELIQALQAMPEDRREELACFKDENDDVTEIDCLDEVSLNEIVAYSNIGNDELDTTYALGG